MRYICILAAACFMAILDLSAQPASQDEGLNLRQQHIVEIASATGRGDLDALKPALGAALDEGLTVSEIREILVHAYAYCGFPRSLRALQTFIEVLDERKEAGLKDTEGREASPVEDRRTRYERGRDILAEISGQPADGPKARYAEFAPVVERFLKEHLFADLFERDVLTYAERELVTVSVIATLGESTTPMLRSHMNICLNLGMTAEQLDLVLAIARMEAGYGAENLFPKGERLPDTPNFTGEGRYREKGQAVRILRPGDVVKIAPNTVHWHGAAPHSAFTHIAIGPQQSKGGAVWLGPATDEE